MYLFNYLSRQSAFIRHLPPGQSSGKVAMKTFQIFIFGLLCCFFTESYAGFRCGSYEQAEFRSICDQFSQSEITLHEDVAADGLNQLRDSWADTPGLHIIPGNRYVLQKRLALTGRQAVLPVPSTTSEKRLNTIRLTTASDFTPDENDKGLLSLAPGSYAGGIAIEEGDQISEILSDPEFSLVSIPSPDAVELALSYFSGNDQSSIKQLVNIGSDQISASGHDPGPVLLNRVLIIAGSAGAGLRIQPGPQGKIRLTNSMIEADSETINAAGGVVELINSELYLAGGCIGGCQAIQSNGCRVEVLGSIFWSEGKGYAINTLSPTGEGENATTGWLAGNAFSSELGVLNAEDHTGLIHLDNYQVLKGSPEPLNNWRHFQQYSGNLGLMRIPSGIMEYACSGNDSKLAIQPEAYQNAVSFNQSGFQVKDFASVNDFNCPWSCTEPIDWGAYGMLTTVAVSFLTHATFIILGCYFGKKHRPRATYVVLPDKA